MRAKPGILRPLFNLIALSLVCALATAFMHPHAPGYAAGRLEEGEITLEQALLRDEAILWVDARTEAEFFEGHIPGAILVNEDDWEMGLMNFFGNFDPDATIIVYCGRAGCQASKAVAERLRREANLENVYHLRGGWEVWKEAQR